MVVIAFALSVVVVVALKYCRCCFLRGLGGIVAAATLAIAVAWRRFSVWSGACTDISHVAA